MGIFLEVCKQNFNSHFLPIFQTQKEAVELVLLRCPSCPPSRLPTSPSYVSPLVQIWPPPPRASPPPLILLQSSPPSVPCLPLMLIPLYFRWQLTTGYLQQTVHLFTCTVKKTMSFGVHCWRKLMLSRLIRVNWVNQG